MSKCFDRGLNPVPSPTTYPPENSADCGRRSDKHSLGTSDIQSVDISHCQSAPCREDKSSYNWNDNSSTSLHSSGVKLCNFEAENPRLSNSAACSMASLSIEPGTDAVYLDDDDNVGWFFTDASGADGDHGQRNVPVALPLLSTVDKVADVGLESASREYDIVPSACGRLSLLEDVDGCTRQTSGTCDRSDSTFNLGRYLPESLVIANSQNSSYCSASDTYNSASVRSSGRERIVLNATTTNSEILPAQRLRTTDQESTCEPPQSHLTTVPEGLRSSVYLSVLDSRSSDGKVPNGKLNSEVSGKHVLRNNSRIFSHSRHFRSIQNAMRTVAGDLSDEIMNDCLQDGELQSPSELSSQVSQDFNAGTQASEIKQFMVHGNMTAERRDRAPGYFSRLERIATCLGHGDDEMMRLAVEICRRQLALNPTQTRLVVIKSFACIEFATK